MNYVFFLVLYSNIRNLAIIWLKIGLFLYRSANPDYLPFVIVSKKPSVINSASQLSSLSSKFEIIITLLCYT